MSRLPRLLRLVHTGTRQPIHPGQSGVPTTSTSPTPHGHLPQSSPNLDVDHLSADNLHLPSLEPSSLASSSSSSPSSSAAAASIAARWTPKGKPIPTRPPRTIPVRLPSGDLPPSTYPPSAEYLEGLVENRKDPHPLWQFFHVPHNSTLPVGKNTKQEVDMGSLESISPEDANLRSGRSWTAAELRQKSFAELHTLWYILLRERNILATQREERRRLGIGANESGELITKRAFRCRKSMARIKYVLNERRLGLIASNAPTSLLSDAAARLVGSGEAQGMAAFLESEEGEEMEEPAVVPEEEVANEEVESRDEGWGGGKEAKEFVEHVKVDQDGHVEKK